MKVISVKINRKIPHNSGFKVKASIVLEDNNLNQITVDSNNTWFSATVDIPTVLGEQALTRESEREAVRYLSEISKGNNPFDSRLPDPLFNSSDELLKVSIITILAESDPQSPLVYNSHECMDAQTDATLKRIFTGISNSRITAIRDSALRIKNARAQLDDYVRVEI